MAASTSPENVLGHSLSKKVNIASGLLIYTRGSWYPLLFQVSTNFSFLRNILNLSNEATVFITVCLKRTKIQILRLSNKCNICAGTSYLISFPEGLYWLSRYQRTIGPCYEFEIRMCQKKLTTG